MDLERQNIQMRLAFPEEDRSEAPRAPGEGTEGSMAVCIPESPAVGEYLMEEVCERENLKRALKRVRANRGSPGVDGMRVQELSGYLKEHWPVIREQLLEGTYKPQPVKRVEIPKAGGCAGWGFPRCWTGSSSKAYYRSCSSTGTGASPSTATASGQDDQPTRQ